MSLCRQTKKQFSLDLFMIFTLSSILMLAGCGKKVTTKEKIFIGGTTGDTSLNIGGTTVPKPVTLVQSNTTDTTPPLSGSITDPDAAVQVIVNGSTYDAINNKNGTWSLPDNVINTLPPGVYDVVVKVIPSSGEPIQETFPKAITVNPVVTLTPLTTADTTPALSGEINDPDTAVEVTINGETYPATNNGNGTWSLPDDVVNTLPPNIYNAIVTATPASGGPIVTSSQVITILPLSVSVADLVTDDQNPQLGGSVNDPNATIKVTVDGTDYDATNNGDGTWSLADDTLPPLESGSHEVEVVATLADLSASAESALTITAQSAPPTIPLNVGIDLLSTKDTTPPLSGLVNYPDANIVVTVNSVDYPATNKGDGTWSLEDDQIASLPPNIYDVVVSATRDDITATDATTGELTIEAAKSFPIQDMTLSNFSTPIPESSGLQGWVPTVGNPSIQSADGTNLNTGVFNIIHR